MPTRRSSRTSAAPVQATPETPGASRAALRRRVAGTPTTSTEPVVSAANLPAPSVSAGATPLSRRARRAQAVGKTAPVASGIAEALVIDSAPESVDVPHEIVDTLAKLVVAEAMAASTTAAPLAEISEPTTTELVVVAQPVAVGAERADAERPRTERVEPLTGAIPLPPASDVDAFEEAARLFSFTGENPIQTVQADAAPAAGKAPAAHVAPRRSRANAGASFRRAATASFSIGVLGIVGLMTVGMTTPAEAVAAAGGTDTSMAVIAPASTTAPAIDKDEIQAYVAPASVQADSLDRDETYATTTTAELASEAGIRYFSNLFHNNPNSNIQWPFSVGVPMSYGFGMRDGQMHEGIDFTPGEGSPVQAIADGTVRVATENGSAYGVHVIIDHIIDGELVSSHYAHMLYGSLQVTPGQRVTVGTVIGHTGDTGRSFGAHTHFEILQNGTTPIDPMPWLQEYTDGTHTVG